MNVPFELPGAIASSLKRFGDAFLDRQRQFVLSLRDASGGYPGRQGHADLYYTRFALCALEAAGSDVAEEWAPTRGYLKQNAQNADNVINAFAVLDAARALGSVELSIWDGDGPDRLRGSLTATVRRHATDDGGFASAPEGEADLYHTFLAASALGLMGQEFDDPAATTRLVASRKRPDGGFADFAQHDHGQTNPTAAAIGLLVFLDQTESPLLDDASAFFAKMQRDDGGFAATHDAPVSDLLSTFTSLVALRTLDNLSAVRLADAGRFVKSLALPNGGFAGWPGDEQGDVEYAYYGLGALGLLAERARN